MKNRLRILHLEDDHDYVDLVHSMLAAEGFTVDTVCAANEAEFKAALELGSFDLVLADYLLPGYDGLQALKLCHAQCPELPFLLVSGTIGEHAAIESLKSGATDYVLKHWPERLVPAVRRAVQEAEERANRLHAETELVRRERRFRSLTEHASDIITILSRDGIFQYNSHSTKRVLGYEPEELVGQSAFALIHPDDLPQVLLTFEQGIQHPELTVTAEFRFRHRDGSWRDLEAVGQSRLGDPEISGVVINSRDVTKRKRIEQQNLSLSKLGQSLSSATSALEASRIIQTIANNLFGWDVFTLDLYSAESDEICPLLNVDTVAGRRLEIPSTNISRRPSGLARRIMEKGAELILKSEPLVLLPDATPVGDPAQPSASLMFVPIRNSKRVIGVLSIQSYTLGAYTEDDLETLQTLADHCGGALERIRTEQALRESEKRFHDLFDASPDGIFVEDGEGVLLDANPAACELHGTTRERLIGRQVEELVPPEQRAAVGEQFRMLASGQRQQVEGFSWTEDGRRVPVEVRASPITRAGKPAVLLHVRDMTERKAAEGAVRSSELLFRSVWGNSVDSMRLTDRDGVIVEVNPAFCKLAGMSHEELVGQPFTVAYAADQPLAQWLAAYQERFRGHGFDDFFERTLVMKDGRRAVLSATSAFVELPGREPLCLSLFREVTEQRRLEEQVRHSQKMEAIGILAGGVAHDFNNLLTVIHGHASLLLGGVNLAPELAASARQIAQAAERAAGLTRQLLMFSRRQVMQPKRVDLNEVVNDLTKMLRRILGEDIVMRLSYSSAPAVVHADVGMLEQVLMNLAVNSRDAMPQGGQLVVSISTADVAAGRARSHPEAGAGRFICLTVSDTGTGIAPEHVPHIFEPFFTTKEVGKGTGLGLATVYGIVKQHQGWIEVTSEVGQGTTFSVFLPRSTEAVEVPAQAGAEPPVRGGTETILVVEDEEPVRELVCNILSGHGYATLSASSGAEALEVWRGKKDRVDLVLTDVVMPHRMSGRQLADTLCAEDPRVKIIFTSGYGAEAAGKDLVLREGVNFLQKPFEARKLATVVRDCLDAA